MPVLFEEIAEHLQRQIVRRMDFLEFMRFQKSSRTAQRLSKCVKNRISMKINEITVEFARSDDDGWEERIVAKELPKFPFEDVAEYPVRFLIKTVYLQGGNDSTYEMVQKFFEESGSSAEEICLCDFHVDYEFMDKVIKATGANSAFVDAHWGQEDVLQLPSIRQMKRIRGNVAAEDEHILGLAASSISLALTDITENGLNTLIKEWLSGDRVIEKILLSHLSNKMDQNRVMEDIPHRQVDGNVVKSVLFTEYEENYSESLFNELHGSFLVNRNDSNLLQLRFVATSTEGELVELFSLKKKHEQ